MEGGGIMTAFNSTPQKFQAFRPGMNAKELRGGLREPRPLARGGAAAYLIIVFAAVLMTSGRCASAADKPYADGVFEGEHSFVRVRVRVKDGKIEDIKILEHGGGGEEYEKMIETLKVKIIEKQSTDVDGVTGATVSSDNLKKAVENALSQKDQVSSP